MKDWLKKALPILKAIYDAFLKGKTIGGVTLPQEEHTLPTRRHEPEIRTLLTVADQERFSREFRQAQERPTQEPEPPFPAKTLGLVGFVVFGIPVLALILLGVIEWRTLADDVPGNHITAAGRRIFKAHPGAVMLALLVWVAFLVAIAGVIAGHIFWP